MTYTEAQKVLREGWIWGRKATDADRERARSMIAKVDRHPADWFPGTEGTHFAGKPL